MGQPEALIPLLEVSPWQMSFGERAALEGVLSQLRPSLAIELGTAEGGSLTRIASHSEEVHSFDLVEPQLAVAEEPHVHIHTGDSHVLLAQELTRFAAEGRNVDFALVDGDHSTEGVRRDMEDLLGSPSVQRTVILMHDTANEVVREGLEQVAYDAFPKVRHVDLDFVPGAVYREPGLLHELWGGLGLVVVDATQSGYTGQPARQQRYFDAAVMLRMARDQLVAEAASDGDAAPAPAPAPAPAVPAPALAPRPRAASRRRQILRAARAAARRLG